MPCDIPIGSYGLPYIKDGERVLFCLSEDQLKIILCHGLSSHNVTLGGGFRAGANSENTGKGVALGKNAIVSAPNAIQLGEGINEEDKTFNIFNWKLLDSFGKIPENRLPSYKIEFQVENNIVQWRYVDSDTWYDLFDISDLSGEDATGFIPDAWGELTEDIITDIVNNTSEGRYIYIVDADGDNRVDNTVPAGISGDMSGKILGYDADNQVWVNFGSFTSIQGEPGKSVELRNNGTYIQWRLEGDPSWINIIPIADLKGDKGDIGNTGEAGVTPQFQVNTTHIQVSLDNGSTWNNLVSLSSLMGPAGQNGNDGTPIEVRTSSGWLQWKYKTDTEWISIFNLNTLQGSNGINPEFRSNSTHIQWKLETEASSEWKDLVALSAIKGDKGDSGDKGDKGDKGDPGDSIEVRVELGILQWRVIGDTEWIDLINLGQETIVVDEALSDTSENPVQNKVIKEAIDNVDGSKWELENIPSGFRLPTGSEWDEERLTWDTGNSAGAFGSVLKLPVAGARWYDSGSFYLVDSYGFYWSSTVDGTNSRNLYFFSSDASILSYRRTIGHSVRLIKEGDFSENPNQTIIINGLTYQTVFNPTTGKVWLDRNLGATQVATSSTDADAYGDLYQWGRSADGHEKRDSAIHDGDVDGKPSTPTESGAWDGKFITTDVSPYDWLDPQDNNLWQGVEGVNNPAPSIQKYIPKNEIPYSLKDSLEIDEDTGSDDNYISEKGNALPIPTIPEQIQSDWGEEDTSSLAYIKNKDSVDQSKWELATETKIGYGALYNAYVVEYSENNSIPLIEGMYIPQNSDWNDFGPDSVIGGKLKSTRVVPDSHPRWDSLSGGTTDEFNMSIYPSSAREYLGNFNSLGTGCGFWSSVWYDANKWYYQFFAHDYDRVIPSFDNKKTGLSIRLIRPLTTEEINGGYNTGDVIGTVQDYDNNVYDLIKGNNYAWLGQNLITTRFSNGVPIDNIVLDSEWSAATSPAYCWYNNNINTDGIFYQSITEDGIKPKDSKKYSLKDALEIKGDGDPDKFINEQGDAVKVTTDVKVQFDSTINTETFDVVASMHNQFIDVDYPTEVTATILETGGLPVGGITTFEQMGAGNILFVVENSSTMTIQKDKNKTSDDSDVVQLMRKEDISGVQQYRVIGGVE